VRWSTLALFAVLPPATSADFPLFRLVIR